MEDYLSEKEQLERVTAWFRVNGAWILIGLVAGGLAVAGTRWWQAHTEHRDLAAAQRYEEIITDFENGNRTRGLDLVGQLASDYAGSPYVDQANLAASRLLLETGQADRAAAYLQTVMDHSHDPELATVARLRLARVQLSQGRPDAALATLGSANRGAFEAGFDEVRGDAYYAKNDKAEALREYRAARLAAGPATVPDDALDLKINDLAGDAGAASAVPTKGK